MKLRTDWYVETMRITVFPSDISAIDMQMVWNSVMDQEPDAIQFQKDVVDAREIRFGNGRMVLAKQPDKIDWHYLSIQDRADSEQLPIIGKLEEELNAFSELANAWFVSSDMLAINRLAFGSVLLRPVNTVEEGNSILAELLPKMNLKGARDFNYQINRRRKSKVDTEIEVNRLSKWNVYSGQLVTVAVNPMQGQQITTTARRSMASRLELDINTFPERRVSLPPNKLSEMFGELVDLGLEISEEGDIA